MKKNNKLITIGLTALMSANLFATVIPSSPVFAAKPKKANLPVFTMHDKTVWKAKRVQDPNGYYLESDTYDIFAPHIKKSKIKILKRGTTSTSVSFKYTKHLNTIFNVRESGVGYYLTVGKYNKKTKKIKQNKVILITHHGELAKAIRACLK